MVMKNTEDLAQEIATLAAHLDAAAHHLLECIRDFDQAGGWNEQGASFVRALADMAGGMGPGHRAGACAGGARPG